MSLCTKSDAAVISISEAWSLLQQFYWDLDHFDYSRLGSYFDERSVLHRKGAELVGLPQINGTLVTRDPHVVTRHVLSVPVHKKGFENTLAIGGYMTVYRQASAGSDERPLFSSGPWRLYDVHSEWRWMDGAPVVSSLRMSPIYEFESTGRM